jgi:hypothetical protein
VATDKKNIPTFPIEGMPSRPGLEEQIIQVAQSAIYPALTPAVRVLDVPGKPGSVVAVVKVAESVEAPHAVDGASKVYVRIASTTTPYTLADINRIDYLLRRRQEPERLREEIVQRIAARSICRDEMPRARVTVAPVYPRGTMVAMDTLLARAERLQKGRSRHLAEYRLIHNGIRSFSAVPGKRLWHFEAETHGVVFFEEPQAYVLSPLRNRSTGQELHYVNLHHLVAPLETTLQTAAGLLEATVTNVLIRYELFGYAGVSFLAAPPSQFPDAMETGLEQRCDDAYVEVTAVQISRDPAGGACDFLGISDEIGPGPDQVPGSCCPN